jgi:hypothetical protein
VVAEVSEHVRFGAQADLVEEIREAQTVWELHRTENDSHLGKNKLAAVGTKTPDVILAEILPVDDAADGKEGKVELQKKRDEKIRVGVSKLRGNENKKRNRREQRGEIKFGLIFFGGRDGRKAYYKLVHARLFLMGRD